MNEFKAGDIVWYANHCSPPGVWQCVVTYVPTNPSYEIGIDVGGLIGTILRPRRYIFHNKHDARNVLR